MNTAWPWRGLGASAAACAFVILNYAEVSSFILSSGSWRLPSASSVSISSCDQCKNKCWTCEWQNNAHVRPALYLSWPWEGLKAKFSPKSVWQTTNFKNINQLTITLTHCPTDSRLNHKLWWDETLNLNACQYPILILNLRFALDFTVHLFFIYLKQRNICKHSRLGHPVNCNSESLGVIQFYFTTADWF